MRIFFLFGQPLQTPVVCVYVCLCVFLENASRKERKRRKKRERRRRRRRSAYKRIAGGECVTLASS